jgi:hypothetical protein
LQVLLPAADIVPNPQLVHEDDPILSLYVPAIQAVHVEAFTVVEYIPIGQAIHAPLSARR